MLKNKKTDFCLEKLLSELVKQTQENTVLLQQALAELQELKQQVQSQKKIPFTVKTCGFEVQNAGGVWGGCGGTLRMFGWGGAAGTLKPLPSTRPCSGV